MIMRDMIAKVVVDVPTMQTDKPFSYLVPNEFVSLVGIGMRVHVPFGKSNRLMQGFIVDIESISDASVDDDDKAIKTLKSISEVLDFEPVLNQEQLELADAMRRTVFAYKISILKAMLPNLLNSSYDKVLSTTDLTIANRYFDGKPEKRFSSLDHQEQAMMMKLHREGKIKLTYIAESKAGIKVEKRLSLDDAEQLKTLQFTARAKKRLAFKSFLQEHLA